MKEQCDICGEIKAVHMTDEEGNSICTDCYNIVQSLESPKKRKANERINIQVSRDTHRKLKELGRRNETFDQIVSRAINALNKEEK